MASFDNTGADHPEPYELSERDLKQETNDPTSASKRLNKRWLIIIGIGVLIVVVVAVVTTVVLLFAGDSPEDPPKEEKPPLEGIVTTPCSLVAAFGFVDANGISTWNDWFEGVEFNRNLVSCEGLVENSTVSVNTSGLFFTCFSAGVGRERSMLMKIQDEDEDVGNLVRRTEMHRATDTVARTVLFHQQNSTRLSVAAAGNMFDRNSYLFSSWSGFRMDSALNLTDVFFADRTTIQNAPGRIVYDRPLVAIGQGFYPAQSLFTAGTPGVFFFSVTMGISDGEANHTQVSLRVNSEDYMLLHASNTHLNGLDTLSQSLLVELDQGDEVEMYLDHGTLVNTPGAAMTSFTGFLYEPSLNAPVAWYAHRTDDWEAIPGPPYNPVTYNTVSVNVGGAYNAISHQVVLPYSGIYYVHASAGIRDNKKIWLQIRHNGVNVGSVARMDDEETAGESVVARGLILEGEEGDTVHIWADSCPTCALFSTDVGKETSFMGFLISPMIDSLKLDHISK